MPQRLTTPAMALLERLAPSPEADRLERSRRLAGAEGLVLTNRELRAVEKVLKNGYFPVGA